MELLEMLKANQNLVVVATEKTHKSSILRVNKTLSKYFQSICYVAVTQSANTLIADFGKNGIDLKKYHFIDCISKKSGIKAISEQITFIPSPSALTNLGIAISKIMETKKSDLLFLDAVSPLLIYYDELSIV